MKTSMMWTVVSIMLMLLLAVLLDPIKAQDNQIYACRTDRVDLIEIQFHNFTVLGDAYWFLGDSGYVDPSDPSILYVQALTSYANDETNFVVAGEAIAGNQDYTVELVGNGDTPLCGEGQWTVTMSGVNFSTLPEQPTPTPIPAPISQPAPVIASQPVIVPRTCTIQYPLIILVCQ